MPLANSGGSSAGQRTEHISKKRPPKTVDWTHDGDAVEWGCRGTANLQLERCRLTRTHAVSTSPGTNRVGASSAARPALSQTPRTIRPFLRGSAAPPARGGTLSPRSVPAPRLWNSIELKKLGRKTSTG